MSPSTIMGLLAQTQSAGALSWIDAEVARLADVLHGEDLYQALSILTLGGAAAVGIKGLTLWLRRAGLDPGQRGGQLATVALVVVILIVTDRLLLWLLKHSPMLTLGVTVMLIVALGLSGVTLMRNLLSGLGIALRGNLQPGVHVEIDGQEGVIERIGPATMRIMTPDEELLFIPNRRFREVAFSVRAPERMASVVVRFTLPRPASDDDCVVARRAALLCPYRHFDSDVHVQVEGERDERLVIRFQTPSEPVALRAEQFMRRALESRLRAG